MQTRRYFSSTFEYFAASTEYNKHFGAMFGAHYHQSHTISSSVLACGSDFGDVCQFSTHLNTGFTASEHGSTQNKNGKSRHSFPTQLALISNSIQAAAPPSGRPKICMK